MDPKPPHQNELDELIIEYEAKAQSQLRTAWIFMSLVFISLIAGILVFVFAERLTEADTGRRSIQNRLTDVIGLRNNYYKSAQMLIKKSDSLYKVYYDWSENAIFSRENQAATLITKITPMITIEGALIINRDSLRHEVYHHYFDGLLDLTDDNTSIDKRRLFALGPGSGIIFPDEESTKVFSSLVFEQVEDMAERLVEDGRQKEKAKAYRDTAMLYKENLVLSIREPLQEVNSKIDSLEQIQEVLSDRILQIDQGFFDAQGEISTSRLIQINVTRFGSILMILFFIRIIIPQYRYNIKLANFFEARSNALKIYNLGLSEDGPEFWANLLTPNMNFGPEPETPYDKIIDLVKLARK